MDSNSFKLRKRMASIDIVPSNQEYAKQQNNSSTNKAPRNNLDYKSYAVQRSSRKNEVLQRMRNIKKQIFKSIEESELLNTQDKKTFLKQKQNVFIKNLKNLPNIDNQILPSLALNQFQKPFENISTAPTATTTTITTISPKTYSNDQSKPVILSDSINNESNKKYIDNISKTLLKRRASSPLFEDKELAKRRQISPDEKKNQAEEKKLDLEKTQSDLSESVVDFLQRDLKANRINVESFLNTYVPDEVCTSDENTAKSIAKVPKNKETANDDGSSIINDLIEQVENENITAKKQDEENAANKIKTSDSFNLIEDFDDSRDIDLLAKFGLQFVKLPEIEDVTTLADSNEMYEKARKFAEVYECSPRIWSTRSAEGQALTDELDRSFKGLLNDVNKIFNTELTIVELKHLVNLTNFWFAKNCNNKLIEKHNIPESTNRFLSMFYYIPRTTKRFYFCEYCEKHFNTEHKYFTHRMVHTGELFPYKCKKCLQSFKILKQFKSHECYSNKKNI